MTQTQTPAGSSARTLWGRVSARTGTILWSVVTVVVLALLVYGASAVSAPKDPTRITKLTPAEQSKLYYDQALAQQAQGNVDEALTLAEKSAKLDSGNQQAKALVVKLRTAIARSEGGTAASAQGSTTGSATTTTGSATTTTEPPAQDSAYDKPAGDITVFLPVKIEGWSLAAPVGVGADGTVGGEPAASNTPMRRVSRALLAVHDRETPQGAQAFVDNSVKRVYPESGQAIMVGGVPGYFGTDGVRLAAVAFARGRYAFEVVLTIPSGSPAKFKTAAESLAAAFPTQP